MTSARTRPLLRLLKWIGIGLLGLLILIVLAGTIWEQMERAKTRKAYPPPGKLVDIGGRKMHIDCRGTGSPTIILEAGLDNNGSLAWDKVHDAIARDTRTCAYDRAGVMWSDDKSTPQNAEAVADDLHALLAASGIGGPIVLVGHSLGGPYAMTYVRKYGDQVKGLVFVDASHPDQKTRLPAAVQAADRKVQEMYGTQRLLAKFAWMGAPRLMMGSDPGGSPGFTKRTIEVGNAYAPMTVEGTLKEAAAIDESLAQAGKLRDLGGRPLVVLTAQKLPTELFTAFGMTEQDARDFVASWRKLTEDEATWSKRSRLTLVPDATHYIQNDRPDLVIQAAADVVAQVRRDEAPSPRPPAN